MTTLDAITATLASIPFGMPEPWAIAVTGIATAAGALAPLAGKKMLEFKTREAEGFFERRCREYGEWVAEHGERPTMVGKTSSYERDLVRWQMSVCKAAGDGALDADQCQLLADAGVLSCDADRAAMLVERSKPAGSRKEPYKLDVKLWMVMLCAVAMGLTAALCAACGANPAALVLACLLAYTVEVAMVCDCKAYIIPWQLSYACYPLAAAFAVAASWPDPLPGLGWGLFACVAMYVLFFATNKIVAVVFGNRQGLGGGDMRLIPAIAISGCGFGSLAGFVVMALAMLLVTVIAMVREGDGFKSYVPMAPGLMAWTAAGCAVAAGLGAAM